MTHTTNPTPPISARAFLYVVMLTLPAFALIFVVASSDGRWSAQTGEVVSGSGEVMVEEGDEEIKDYEDYKENKEYNEDIQDNSAAVTSSLSSLSSLISLSSFASSSSAVTSSLSSLFSLSSLSSFALPLPSFHLVTDALNSEHTPALAIAKSGDFQESSDIVGKISVTLTGFGKTLVTDLRMEETDEEILIYVETPAVFRPGEYDLMVTWTASRTDLRLMEKLFDRADDGEETVLLEQRIELGAISLETERVQTIASTEGDLAITRTSVIRTTPGAEETMTIAITPKATFVGTVTESVPAGFKVGSVTPFAEITETEDGTMLSWNREFIGGTALTLSYTFTTSPVSPLFAQFGPLEAKGTVTDVVSEERVVEEENEENKENKDYKESTDDANQSSAITSSSLSSLSSFDSSSLSSLSSLISLSSFASSSSASSSSASSSSATGSDLSWFRRLLLLAQLSLQTGEPFRFTEAHRWAMLVLAPEAQEGRAAGALLLEPLHGGVFDANALPSFTLIAEPVSGTGADAFDANGRFHETKALTAIVQTITDENTIQESILSDLLEGQSEDIADAITQDSDAVNTLLEGKVERSPKRAAAAKAEEALEDEKMRRDASVILVADQEIQNALAALVTDEMQQTIVEQAINVSTGKKSETTQDLLTDAAGIVAVDSVTNAVVDAIRNKDTTKQQIAQSMVDASSLLPSAPAPTSFVPVVVTPAKREKREILTVHVRDAQGTTFTPKFHFVPGSVILVLEPERAFTPGLYSLEVSVFNPLTNETVTQTADFAWGVLAMNPAQDRYKAGDIVDLAIGVLDDGGRIVCDAELELKVALRGSAACHPEVLASENEQATKDGSGAPQCDTPVISLSTEDGSIETGLSCGIKEAGLIDPDYFTSFSAVEAGIYELTLTATTANGTRSMTSTIEVSEPPFLIRRIGATRLWPLAPSPMHITVTFTVPVTGTVTETLPPGFIVSDIRPAATVRKEDDGSTTLRWKGSWKEGEQTTLRYLFDAPDISPQFYLLGPLKISSALPFFTAP